ncbi:hypothetical protein QQZ08_006803 [Neonectria magnoliae]|uniref:CFEM domain-containing protein n=1 Tax=Neonectria magnoliae TaxID=2732573 RepID=A0ABR1HZG0_9HYPO
MKYAFVALALAAAARAQSRDDIPKCALDCLDEGIESETSCSTTDYACVCKDFSKVQTAATSCVIDACGADVAVNDVLPAVQALCKAIESGGGGESSAAKTSAAETSAAETSAVEETSSAAAETTSAAAETTTEAAEPTTTEAAETTTTTSEAVEETTSEAVEETTTAAAPPASTPNASTPGASEPTETGAAAALGSIGGLAMLVLAAFAL